MLSRRVCKFASEIASSEVSGFAGAGSGFRVATGCVDAVVSILMLFDRGVSSDTAGVCKVGAGCTTGSGAGCVFAGCEFANESENDAGIELPPAADM